MGGRSFAEFCGRGDALESRVGSQSSSELTDAGDGVESPVVGYDKASKIAYKALEEETTLKVAALSTGLIDKKTFDEVVNPQKMAFPNG